MRFQLISDLYLDMAGRLDGHEAITLNPQADALIVAGNAHAQAGEAIDYFATCPIPVCYVPGPRDAITEPEALRKQARYSPVQVLLDDVAYFDRVRIVSFGLATVPEPERLLRASTTPAGARPDAPIAALARHDRSVALLLERLAVPFSGWTIVVSAHAPTEVVQRGRSFLEDSQRSIDSDLPWLMQRIHVWAHGGLAQTYDYDTEGCRVLCNGRGEPEDWRWLVKTSRDRFWPPRVRFANSTYDPSFLFELA